MRRSSLQNRVVVILLLSSIALLLIDAEVSSKTTLVFWLALFVGIIGIVLFISPISFLFIRLNLPIRLLTDLIHRGTKTIPFIISKLQGSARPTLKPTKEVILLEDPVTEEVSDDESTFDLLKWWVTTPILPESGREWIAALIIVIIASSFYIISFERMMSGSHGLDVFYFWLGGF